MPAEMLDQSSRVVCFHSSGQVSAVASSRRVKVGGVAAVVVSDNFQVAGCPFTLPPPSAKPQPCVKVVWIVGASRVKIGGIPAVLKSSTGLCQSAEQIPQGTPQVKQVQQRVTAS